jgi:hypothetical protein
VPKLKTPRRGTSPKKAAKGRATTSKAAREGTKPKNVEAASPEDEAAFTEALIQSGEAACLDQNGKLPAGATHKIVEDEAGKTKAVRRRFSVT